MKNMNRVYSEALLRLRHEGTKVGNTIEVLNSTLTLEDATKLEITCPDRKFNLKYAIAEFLFYAGMDPAVGNMDKFAKIWGDIKDENGEVNSNYGCYIFNENWGITASELKANPDSRRAVIPILAEKHIQSPNPRDYPCTGYIQFILRNGYLDLIWNMRSQDVIFGLANDYFAAALILQMMRNQLGVRLGTVTFNVGSLHIYERHYHLLNSVPHHGKSMHLEVHPEYLPPDYLWGIDSSFSVEEINEWVDDFYDKVLL